MSFRKYLAAFATGLVFTCIVPSANAFPNSSNENAVREIMQNMSINEPVYFFSYDFFRIREDSKLWYTLSSEEEVRLCENFDFEKGDLIVASNFKTVCLFDDIISEREKSAWLSAKVGPVSFKCLKRLTANEAKELGLTPILDYNPSARFYRVTQNQIRETTLDSKRIYQIMKKS